MTFDGKVTVVTGASTGVGLEVARQFAQGGSDIVLAARTADDLQTAQAEIENVGVDGLSVPTDVSDREQCFALIEQTTERFGRIDVLVNNAGIGLYKPVEDVVPEDLDKALSVNFRGAMYCAQAAYHQMREQGSGHIINVASIAGKTGLPGESAYNASKFAMVGFGQSLKKEAIHHGVRVDNLCPGGIDTPFWDKVPNQPDTSNFLTADDVAGLVVYVASTSERMVFDDITVNPKKEFIDRFA
ncbi:MAG: SDR family oxidoreductase [Candidatus Bipolaricaulia bacterium]